MRPRKHLSCQRNPDLKPETSVNTEIGLHHETAAGSTFSATLFRNEFDNKVTSYDTGVPDPRVFGPPVRNIYVYENISNVTLSSEAFAADVRYCTVLAGFGKRGLLSRVSSSAMVASCIAGMAGAIRKRCAAGGCLACLFAGPAAGCCRLLVLHVPDACADCMDLPRCALASHAREIPLTDRPPTIRRDWVSKTLAGTLLGAVLALEASAVLVRFGPVLPLANTAQLGMWLTIPVWMGVLSLCFLFQSGLRAWAWLGGTSLAGALLLLLAGSRPA